MRLPVMLLSAAAATMVATTAAITAVTTAAAVVLPQATAVIMAVAMVPYPAAIPAGAAAANNLSLNRKGQAMPAPFQGNKSPALSSDSPGFVFYAFAC